ncbi:HORM1 protein, partial [Emberiza fucata]|nr:HORM1 protein [Emberiza fucata]
SAVVFPKKIATEQQSLMLVKRLLAVAVSCITYLRGIFPESAYGTRYMDDVCVKILREDKNSPGSSQLVKWMLGCYDALQKKYFNNSWLCLQTVTECYHFKFKYTHNGPLLDFGRGNSSCEGGQALAQVPRAAVGAPGSLAVPKARLEPPGTVGVFARSKPLNFSAVTPPDYQPPGFKEAKDEGLLFKEEPMYLNVGEVPTPFHLLKLKITTEKQRMESVDKRILKQGETAEPLQVCGVSRDDPEE